MQYEEHSKERVTRGFGLFEIFLAKKRARLANSKISQHFRKGRVLDVGCGYFPYFLSSTDFCEKYGIDSSINEKLFNNKSIIIKRVNLEKDKIPYKNDFFDVVTMLAVFEHIGPQGLEAVLKEIRRVLKKDGIFIITTPAPWSDKVLHLFARLGLVSKVEIDDHKHALTSSTIKTILSQAGFEKRKISNGYFEAFFNMWFTAEK